MEDLTLYMKKFVANVSPHATLAGLFSTKLREQPTPKKKNYFAVTDICNPLKTYFKFKYPELFKYTIETQKKFVLGNRQHYLNEKKFERLEGFEDKELILDGELLGIPLKGRADAKISGSLWELKSKGSLPENVNDLLKRHPQDIEQLAFYSLLDPTHPKENYLVMATYYNPTKYKVFCIKILDTSKIKELVMNRINKLNNWLSSDEKIEASYRCRYCSFDCIFKEKGFCSYFENPPLPCEISNFLEITECPEIEEKLDGIILFELGENPTYTIYCLIIARKIINQEHSDLEGEEYDNTEKKMNRQFIQNLIYRLKYMISAKDLINLKSNQKIKEIRQNKGDFIKIISNGKEKIFPVLIHISDQQDPSLLSYVSNYKKGELAIHCLNNSANKGYLISYFPKQNDEIKVFEISYNLDKDALRELKKIVEILNTKDKERLSELRKCPNFICKDCVYKEICPSE